MQGGFLRPHHSGISLLQRLLDAGLICVALWFSHWAYSVDLAEHNAVSAALAVFGFFLIAESRGLYASWRVGGMVDEVTDIFVAWGMVVVALVMIAFMSKTSANFSRVAVTFWFIVAPFGLIMTRVFVRMALRELRRAGKNSRSLAIVGATAQAISLIEKTSANPWTGMKSLGIFDDEKNDSVPEAIRPYVKGTIADLMAMVREGKVDYVYIVLPMQEEKRIVEIVDALADTTASVYVVPGLFVSDLLHSKWIHFNGITAIEVYETPFMGINGWIKRLEDIILGSIFLAVAAIPMFVIGLAVKFTSPGAVLFKQRRYGLNGEVVEVWKFRSMSVTENGDDVLQARKGDPRITPLGKFLRKTSLDEFPQLINVLQGRMSLVGPRPHAVAHNEEYRKLIHGYMLRHKVKPGITGWAQVNGWRGETQTLDKMEKRIEYDLEYIRNWSLWLDVKILWLTILRGFIGKNAY